MSNFKRALRYGAVVVTSVVIASPAMAAGGVDLTAVTAALGETGTAIATIGAAVLVVAVGLKGWKWLQRAL